MNELTDRDKWMTVARSLIKHDAPPVLVQHFFVPSRCNSSLNISQMKRLSIFTGRLSQPVSWRRPRATFPRKKKGGKFCMSPELLLGLRKWLSSSMASCLQREKKKKSSIVSRLLFARRTRDVRKYSWIRKCEGREEKCAFRATFDIKILNLSEEFIRDYERQSNGEISGSTFFINDERWRLMNVDAMGFIWKWRKSFNEN